MNIRRIILTGGLLAVAGSLVMASTANATRPPELKVSPAQVPVNGAITVSGYCPVNADPAGPVTSPGFAAPITLGKTSTGQQDPSGTGKVVAKPGTYTATMHCRNWSSPVTATFTVTGSECRLEPGSTGSCGWITVSPKSAKPGEQVDVEAGCLNNAKAKPESAALTGFVTAGTRHWRATVAANAKPGKHSASVTCPERTYSASFTVSGSGGTTAPAPPVKQTARVPSGAPETGDGSFAALN
ncbi:hypothetical protein [Amycolatopsis minnesotensis]|uniref:Ig-like domain-containing protein n=1 Tax=Amycolatopsis minnesotensis TaxID=337894 RepID=A0ABP5D7M6_9PSEU